MSELLRYLSLLLLIIFNQIFLAVGVWHYLPDIFLIQTLILTAFTKKLPNVYFFILKGFLIDLFFSNFALPYTATYAIIGLYLNFSTLKWIQRSLLEQLLLIIAITLALNLCLFYINQFSDELNMRIILNPVLNCILWIIIFFNQRQKWLKNI
tara:strand:+ start:47 stop:505 length:459 start_codon:yes stop_codon:yes gene_type:complete